MTPKTRALESTTLAALACFAACHAALLAGGCGKASEAPPDASAPDAASPLDATADQSSVDAGVDTGVAARALVPRIDGPFWNIAGNPDLGALTGPSQQPVDFAVWKAADGTWQLQSCIRFTKEPVNSRLFYRWQGARLEDTDWTPVGIAMRADTTVGEPPGGLQAPFVMPPEVAGDGVFHLFYGDYVHIAEATAADGKAFARVLDDAGASAMFSEGQSDNTRDPMVIRNAPPGGGFTIYYTAFPNGQGSVYARTSTDLRNWSASQRVAFGGAAGSGPTSAECPFVVARDGYYYLFRTQLYGDPSVTRVYRSPDPMDFGKNDDRYLIAELPVAAPEIVLDRGQWYIAATKTTLDGIRIARLAWDLQ